ncbi:MAG: RNA polymerase sigma factor RpoS, partial [Betaproteobacteria bacterium]|nr:RNA polymerase sigma factor RpoS [Betaproteobacteria bacterium]
MSNPPFNEEDEFPNEGRSLPDEDEVDAVSELKEVHGDHQFDPTLTYLNEIGQNTLLTAKEERELATLVRQGDFNARQRMIKCNLRLVVSIAKHYTNRGLDL